MDIKVIMKEEFILLNIWNELKREYDKKKIQMPIKYWIFFISLIRYFGQRYLNKVNLNYFIPVKINDMILQFFNFIYSDGIFILVILIFWMITGIFLFTFSKMGAYKLIPEETKYIDRKTISWNYIEATKRPLYAIKWYCTELWIWYFFYNVFFNSNDFINNFWPIYNKDIFSNLLFVLNVLLLFWYILGAFFKTKLNTNYYLGINKEDAHSQFIPLDMYINKENEKIMILKTKYEIHVQYILAEVQQNEYLNVLDTSSSLNEIKIHFDSISEGRLSSDW